MNSPITYEQAERLKEAGFPQKEGRGALYITPSGDIFPWEGFGGSEGTEYVYLPSLSELIAECGDEFNGLYPDPNSRDKYRADSFTDELSLTGATPESAVAELYLALKKSNGE